MVILVGDTTQEMWPFLKDGDEKKMDICGLCKERRTDVDSFPFDDFSTAFRCHLVKLKSEI